MEKEKAISGQQLENNKKIFENMKTSYNKQTMPVEAVEQMKEKMKIAKTMNRIARRRKAEKIVLATAASLAIVLFGLPNTSQGVATAMEKVPGLSKVVKVAVVRNYKEKEEKKSVANIEASQVEVTTATDNSEVKNQVPEEKVEVRTAESEIPVISDQLVAKFKASVKDNEGYNDVLIKSNPIEITDEFFTLKIVCYLPGGSGVQWAYYYTVDLESGKTIHLKDLFKEDSNYIDVISQNIKDQMRAEMKENDDLVYWIDSDESIAAWDFDKITENAGFYLDHNKNVVISFDEGEVAPMSEGIVTFTIPRSVLEDILK